MNKHLKNPLFFCLIAFLIGFGLVVWGGSKNTSTSASRTKGGVTMEAIGWVLLVGGIAGGFVFGRGKKQ